MARAIARGVYAATPPTATFSGLVVASQLRCRVHATAMQLRVLGSIRHCIAKAQPCAMTMRNCSPALQSLAPWPAASARAGDVAELEILGFSDDGGVFAFEEYGVQDGSGFPYANRYYIDTATTNSCREHRSVCAWTTKTPRSTLRAAKSRSRRKDRQPGRARGQSRLHRRLQRGDRILGRSVPHGGQPAADLLSGRRAAGIPARGDSAERHRAVARAWARSTAFACCASMHATAGRRRYCMRTSQSRRAAAARTATVSAACRRSSWKHS